MRITKLELGNFKRFSDLTIEGIPSTSKLVLLIGANGSGKSSVFDAFDVVSRRMNIFDASYRIEPELKDYFSKGEGALKLQITFSENANAQQKPNLVFKKAPLKLTTTY